MNTKYERKSHSGCINTIFNKAGALFNRSVYAVVLVCVSVEFNLHIPVYIIYVRSCIPWPHPAFHRLQYIGETRSEATWSVHYSEASLSCSALLALARLNALHSSLILLTVTTHAKTGRKQRMVCM